MSNPSMKIETISPAQAKLWLSDDINQNNRNISGPLVASYANEMREGRWVLGSPVMFNSEGKLIDGQHRLAAIVDFGKGAQFAVMRDVPDAAREVIDQGRARSVTDILRMMHGQGRASLVTGAIRVLDKIVHGYGHKLSTGHALEMIDRYDDGIKWAVDNIPGRTVFTSSPVVAAMIFAYRLSPSTVETFARRFFVGDGLAASSPILIARNQIQRMGTLIYSDQKRDAFMLILHAIYKVQHSQSVGGKSIRVREDMVDIFARAYVTPKKAKAAA